MVEQVSFLKAKAFAQAVGIDKSDGKHGKRPKPFQAGSRGIKFPKDMDAGLIAGWSATGEQLYLLPVLHWPVTDPTAKEFRWQALINPPRPLSGRLAPGSRATPNNWCLVLLHGLTGPT